MVETEEEIREACALNSCGKIADSMEYHNHDKGIVNLYCVEGHIRKIKSKCIIVVISRKNGNPNIYIARPIYKIGKYDCYTASVSDIIKIRDN